MTTTTLTFNLAYEPFGFGIYRGSEIITESYQKSSRKFSENLVDRLKTECKLNNINYDNLSAVGLINGPGSYTGLRISVSVAKTNAYTLKIPISSCTALQAIALQATLVNQTYISVIPSKKGFLYVQLFNRERSGSLVDVSESLYLSISEFFNLIAKFKVPINLIGILDETTKSELENQENISFFETYISCKTIHSYVINCLKHKTESEFKQIKPFYFHEPNIGIIKKKNSKFKTN